jgi:hypothetical protein
MGVVSKNLDFLDIRRRASRGGWIYVFFRDGTVRLPPFFGAFLYGNCPFWVLFCSESSLFGAKSRMKLTFWGLVGW